MLIGPSGCLYLIIEFKPSDSLGILLHGHILFAGALLASS